MLIRFAVVVVFILFVLKTAVAAAAAAASLTSSHAHVNIHAHAQHIKMNVDSSSTAAAAGDDWRLGIGHQRSRKTTELKSSKENDPDTQPPSSSNNIYYTEWCGGELQYLDDKYCIKKFPSKMDRSQTCPVAVLDSVPEGYYPDSNLADNAHVDTTSLGSIITNGANLCVILTKRVRQSDGSVKLYNKYFCANEASKTEAFETWSSSKIFAIANAGGHLRGGESTCANGVYGIDGSTFAKNGDTNIGDLATVICSYDHTKGYSSNSLSSYMHDIGWRDRIHSLVKNPQWLNLSDLSLGGNYGEATPSDLTMKITDGAWFNMGGHDNRHRRLRAIFP